MFKRILGAVVGVLGAASVASATVGDIFTAADTTAFATSTSALLVGVIALPLLFVATRLVTKAIRMYSRG